jgi:hypothetical protein
LDLADDQELANTERKLAALGEQIAKAKLRPSTPANLQSLRALVEMANQFREEIVRYRAAQKRQAS